MRSVLRYELELATPPVRTATPSSASQLELATAALGTQMFDVRSEVERAMSVLRAEISELRAKLASAELHAAEHSREAGKITMLLPLHVDHPWQIRSEPASNPKQLVVAARGVGVRQREHSITLEPAASGRQIVLPVSPVAGKAVTPVTDGHRLTA